MRVTRWLLAITLTLLSVTTASAADASWTQQKDKDGIQVYTRPVEGWNMSEMRGVGKVSARLSALVAVINDVQASPQLNDSVTTAKVTTHDSDTRYQFYSTMDAPWPVSNRDVLNQRDIAQDKDSLVVTISDVATNGVMPELKGYARITKSRLQWTLTPTPEGPIQIEYRSLSDPAGSVPKALVEAVAMNLPYKVIKQLGELAKDPKYATATLPFIKEPAHP